MDFSHLLRPHDFSDQAEAHRAKNRAARERRAERTVVKKNLAADDEVTVAAPLTVVWVQ